MTREDLAKDILLAYIRSQDRAVVEIPFADLAADAVDQADALLDALGVKEAPTSWLSKDMRTPAKGFEVIKEDLRIGDVVELPTDIPECAGLRLRGTLISFPKFGESEVFLPIGDSPRQFIRVPTHRLVRAPE